ncbi:unnamed protein product [Anisakis simplex]|uniref:PPM-type phosphatase domain-containing protein n=1 Tax=Anisakis simplex TaxID=6269 RepID=A0A3P6QZ86_ANISI|nr:unnamed protein product [Anisakis simplex]
MYFSDEDVLLSADQSTRPVLCPRDPSQMPIHAGYAEVINAGIIIERNEDHACAKILTILQRGYEAEEAKELDKPQNMINNNKRRFFTKQPAATQRASSECRRNNTTLNKLLIQRRYSDEDLLALSDSDEKRKSKSERNESIPQSKVIYFSIFDGHAGCEAAIVTSNTLHEHIQRRLSEVIETVLHLDQQEKLFSSTNKLFASSSNNNSSKYITSDSLVVGAIQASFIDMVSNECLFKGKTLVIILIRLVIKMIRLVIILIRLVIIKDEELLKESVSGGCAVLSVMLMNSKMYVANAGDCRAALLLLSSSSDCVDTEPKSSDKAATDKCLSPANSYHIEQITNDFTPDYERKRIQFLAYKNPELIANCFTRYEYSRLLSRCDLKKSVLYRDWFMDGWASKMVCDSDLKPTLISDHGRKVKRRLLNTIGVSRGFGDHHLLTADDKIPIKPFLSPVPEVHVIDLNKYESLNENDVLIMASDGLWDVLSNEDVARIVNSVLNNNENAGLVRYTVAAHELALSARGNYNDKVNRWQLPNGCNASSDDITIFIIPLKYAKYINNKYNIYYSNHYSNSNVFNNNNHPNSDNYDDDDVELLQ